MIPHHKPFTVKRKSTLSEQIKNGYKELLVTIVCLNIILAIILLYTGNISTSQGYILQKLERANENLYTESKLLDSEVTKAKSLESMAENSVVKDMPAVDKLTFIQPETKMAKK